MAESFWDTVQSVGLNTLNKVATPLSNSIGQTFGNLVTGAQSKVAAIGNKIVSTTDPTKNAASPAIPPTTGSTAQLTAAQRAGITSGVVMAAIAIITVIYLMSRKT